MTNRKVLAFLSQAHIEPDITIEVFFVDRPLEGFGVVEVLDTSQPPPPESAAAAVLRRDPNAISAGSPGASAIL